MRARRGDESTAGLALLLFMLLAANCISVAAVQTSVGVAHDHAFGALAGLLLTAGLLPLFLLARFSFGYLVGVGFYGVVAGFVWITYFSNFDYDHGSARLSAIASLLMFLLPVLLQTAPARLTIGLSVRVFDRLMRAALCLALVVLLWNGLYGFAFVGITEAAQLRATLVRPTVMNYITGNVVGAVLPFAFAYFAQRRHYHLAIASILLISLHYPVLLNKTVLFAAIWLPFLLLVFRLFEPRRAAILSLLIPMTLGLIVYAAAPAEAKATYAFGYINVRMFAIPSIAMDYYSDFFAHNELTGFCQINVVRRLLGCPYAQQLGPVFAQSYGVGNLNGSLFATEGIASVGPIWAPVSALVCGLIVSIGNSMSARHAPQMMAVSSGLVVQALLNVPLSTTLLSDGFLTLLLLWYVCPNPSSAPPLSPKGTAGQASENLAE